MTGAVLLDFYGTLARATTWGPTSEEVLSRHGFTFPPEVRRRWNDQRIDGLEHLEPSRSAEHYRAWELDRIRRMVVECGVGPDDADVLVDDLYTAAKSFTIEAYPEVPGVLAQLRGAGVTVAVCSNWDWHLDRALAQAGVDGLVDIVVTSARAGARKPHPRIFRHTLERCGVEPAEALFAGDSWEPDVEGPLAAGMRAVHVWRPEFTDTRGEPPPLTDGVVRVEDLRGVVDALG
jgi:putative hydrolase of the HAD superfamily